MMAHPDYVAGEGRLPARSLMRAMAWARSGQDGGRRRVYRRHHTLEKRLGIAVKIEDGATRAAEATIASLLVRRPACSTRNTPHAIALMHGPIRNRRGSCDRSRRTRGGHRRLDPLIRL
jgi:L-asparaginase II